jgi:hypothetical protein
MKCWGMRRKIGRKFGRIGGYGMTRWVFSIKLNDVIKKV